jgi:hypothetical protein
MKTLKDQILDILNEDLSPWVFDGSEPMAERIVALCESSISKAAPDDLVVDIRQGVLWLWSGNRMVELNIKDVFRDGPVSWTALMRRYLNPALAQFK